MNLFKSLLTLSFLKSSKPLELRLTTKSSYGWELYIRPGDSYKELG
jgi:hypothetical protein